jgi:hypothetical protein
MSPGTKISSSNTALPSGRSFAAVDLSSTSFEIKDHAEGEFGILVCARRAATQSATARTSNTTIKILRNVYMTWMALVSTQFKANNGLRDLDLDQTTSGVTGSLEQKEKGPAIPTGPFPHEPALLSLW